MKPSAFAYHDPRTVEEAVGLLAQLENTRLLAGGQSLMPMLNMRVAFADHLIDLNRVQGVAGIRVADGVMHAGAMTRQRDLSDSPAVREHCPLLAEALTHVGHWQTRNRGTLGGSLCNLDPSAELVAVAAALDAAVEVAGPGGTRDVAMADFPLGLMTPSIGADEMVVGVRLPLWPAGHGACFTEFARRHGDYAIASAAVLLLPGADGRVARASVTLGGVDAVPVRMREAEAMLVGQVPSEALFREAAAGCRGIEAMEDVAVPGWYRQRVAGVLMRRALATAWERAGQEAGKGGQVTGKVH